MKMSPVERHHLAVGAAGGALGVESGEAEPWDQVA
jgi:hypothetical protein